MSPWWPWLRLLSRCPVLRSSHCNSFEYINGLVQERHDFSALAMELRLSCTNPLIWQIQISPTCAKSSNELLRLDYMTGYQDSGPNTGYRATCPVELMAKCKRDVTPLLVGIGITSFFALAHRYNTTVTHAHHALWVASVNHCIHIAIYRHLHLLWV